MVKRPYFQSVIVFYREKIASRQEPWKREYGAITVSIDFNATSSAQLFNELAKMATCFLCHEMSYFDNVKEGLNRDCAIVDVSCNMSKPHIEAAVANSFQKVSVASVEEMEIWHQHGFSGEFVLRTSSTNALQDCGCEAEDVVSILREANQKGFKVWIVGRLTSYLIVYNNCSIACCNYARTALSNSQVTGLHFTCLAYERTPARVSDKVKIDFDLETRERASSTLSVMKAVISDLESANLPLLPILITGEGMSSLSLQKDQPDAEKTLSALKELSLRIPITIDGSRFFLDPSCSIYCRVTGKKHNKSENEERFLYYLNNGVYCSFFNAHIRQETLYPKPILVASKEGGRSDQTYDTTVFGPTCDSIDTLGNDFKLPELEEGDWLKFDGNGYRCGNYSPMFNSFEDPDVIII